MQPRAPPATLTNYRRAVWHTHCNIEDTMKLNVLALGCFVGLAALVPGCAEEPPADPFATPMAPTFVPESVNVDQHFADTVTVEASQLVVPIDAANEAFLGRIKVGSIVAGNRNNNVAPDVELVDTKNPYGFLRRVKDVQRAADKVTLITEQAELSDWIDEGDLDFTDSPSLFEGAGTVAPMDAPLQLQGGVQPAAGGSSTAPVNSNLDDPSNKFKLKISNGSFTLNAKHDGYFKKRTKFRVPYKVEFRTHLVLDPSASIDITASATRNIPLSQSKTWTGKSRAIPIGGPIPITIRFEPELSCGVAASGSVAVTTRAQVKGHAAAGVEGKVGISDFDFNDLSEAPSVERPTLSLVSVDGAASITASCKLLAVPVVLAFDAIGIKGKIGPVVGVTAEVCASYDVNNKDVAANFSMYGSLGLAGEFSGRVQVPFLGFGKDFKLADVSLDGPRYYFVGSKDSCTAGDPCKNLSDGEHCVDVSTKPALVDCVAKKTKSRKACPNLCVSAVGSQAATCN
jgi:hypothetical protein